MLFQPRDPTPAVNSNKTPDRNNLYEEKLTVVDGFRDIPVHQWWGRRGDRRAEWWLSHGPDQEVERARPEAGIGTIFEDLLLPTSFYRPGPLKDSMAFKLVPQARDKVSVQNV